MDPDLETGEFTYLLGVGVDTHELHRIEAGMTRVDLPGGFYAVFTTELTEVSNYPQSIRETWDGILTEWLPNSEFELDEERCEYEYYDERDHDWERDGMVQMEIRIPICTRT